MFKSSNPACVRRTGMLAIFRIVVRIKKVAQTVMNRVLAGARPPTSNVVQLNVTLMATPKAGSGVKVKQFIIWQVSHLKEFVIISVVLSIAYRRRNKVATCFLQFFPPS